MLNMKYHCYTGEPADNAAHFIHWLQTLQGNELEGVEYTVFGCGNHDWVQTFQRIPTLCDDLFEKRGGKRLLPRGVGDAGSGDFFQVFDEYETQLWETLCKVRYCFRYIFSVEVLMIRSEI